MTENSGNHNGFLAARNLVLSLLSLASAALIIGLILLSGLINSLAAETGANGIQEIYGLVWIFGFFALLLLPLFVISIYQIRNKPQPAWLRFPVLKPIGVIISFAIWVVILVGSYCLEQQSSLAWPLIPPLKIFAVALPLGLIILYLAQKFNPAEPSRSWGLISFSLVITEPLTIFFEGLLIILLIVGLGLTIDWSQAVGSEGYVYLNRLLFDINNPELLGRILTPFLLQPTILLIGFIIFSLVVPVIEEIMKPLALWFLNKKNMLASDGFYYGAVTGMVFALIESILGLTGLGADSWVSMSVVRVGTGILHIFTSAMMGWALTSSWRSYRMGKLGLTYLGCIAIHGLWNFLAISISVNEILPGSVNSQQELIRIFFPVILVLMALGMLLALLRLGQKLAVEQKTEYLA